MDDAAYEALMVRLNEAYPSQPAYTPENVKPQSGQLTQEQLPLFFNMPRPLEPGMSNPMDFDPSGGVGQFGVMANAGPMSGMLDMSGQNGSTPGYNAMMTARLPEGLSASYRRSNEIGSPWDAENAISLSKALDKGSINATASRSGAHGAPSYDVSYSLPLTTGRNPDAPQFRLPSSREEQPMVPPSRRDRERQPSHKELVGQLYAGAGHRTGDRETHVRGGAKFNFADGGHVDAALHLLRQHFDEGGFLSSLSNLFSGPDYLSTGKEASFANMPTQDETNADFFKADRALRLAREVQAPMTSSVPDRAPLTAPRPGPVEVQELPVNIPFTAPERGASLLSSDISPASVTSLPLAYSPEAPAAPAAAAIDQATGKLTARMPEEPHGTALTKQQADYVIRTIAAETSGKSPEETQAIASVILNRINSGKYGASPEAVLFAKRQFEPWMNKAGANYPMKISQTSQRYSDARDALEAAMAGEDITGGATHFWGPKAQYALGREAPSWGRTGGVDIGETRFHKLERAHGGLVDDALHVVRERHADGEAVGQAPFFTFEPTPETVDRQAARQPAYNPAERTWSDAGSTEGERLTRALGVEGELPKGETFMSAAPTGWDKYMPQRRPGSYLKRFGEALDENAKDVREGYQALKEGNYGAGALGMLSGVMGAGMSPLTAAERVLVRDPILQYTGDLKKAQQAETVADIMATGGVGGMLKPFTKAGSLEKLIAEPLTSTHRLPSPAMTGAATAAGAMLAPEDAEAGNVDRILRGLRAYHGSPHKFDRFDLSKIGTGEGNQSYGHGLYFAENENVAKGYRDQLSGHHIGDVLIGNEKIPNWASRDVINAYKKMGYDNDTAVMASHFLREHKGDINAASGATWSNPNIPDTVAEALLRTEYATPKGHIYEVGIHADPERLLNWDKPFREQSAPVQEAVRYAFGPQPLDARIGSNTMDRPGPIHSRLLNEAGVPGIKYLDAGSRGITGAPTHNYVIFNDKLIDINRRYADGGQIPEGNDMRDHFEGGGLTGSALKLVRKAAQQAPAAKRLFPQVAERYPEMIPPVPTIDKRTGKEFPAKALGQEAMDVQKARAAAQKEINAGNYEPYFPIEQRFDVDPSNYPEINPNTSDLIRMKLPKAVAGYEAKARNPQALENLRVGFEHGLKQKDMAENWYYMGQLEAEFIKEYGPEMGRTLFKQRFPDAMAATTGGADPTSNLMMAHFGNYLHNLGEKMPTKAYEYPFPVAGGKYGIQGNMDQYRKMIMEGEGLTPENPKRYNFSANFLGKKTPTIDEQMSSAWDPKMASPPTGSYGHYEGALTDLSNSMGYDPRYFQEVGWAGIKDMKTPGGFEAQPMIGIVNEAIERTHQITGMPRDEIVRRGLVRAEIPLYGAAGATAAGAMGPEFMQGQGEAPAPEPAEAPMTEERRRGGSVVDRALMLVSRQA